MFNGLFGKKKETPTTPIKSTEYAELLQMIERLRIRFEALEIDLALYKKKLKAKNGIETEEEKVKNDKNLNSMLLPDI